MKLATYLSDHDLSLEQFAGLLAVDTSTVSRWQNHEVVPSGENMRKIYAVTEGQVTPNDFFDVPRGADAAPEGGAS